LRLFYDLFIVEIRLFDQKTIDFYLLNAFGVVLLPCISLFYLNFTKLNFRSILWWTYLLLFLSLSLSLIIKNQSGIESNRSAGDINVGILLYGQYGAMLCLLSIFLFIEKKGYLIRLFFGLGFVIGFLAIFISASRSPILALLFILLVVLLLKFATFKTFLITISTIFVTYVFFEDIFSILNNNFNSSFLLRLQQALDGDTGGRENFIGLGFDDFIENPFLGNAMLLQKQGYIGSYPHNLIVESFMATGFFGGFVFLLWIFKCLKAFFNIIKKNINVSWIAIIFLQFLIFGMFSGNLYSSNLFWFTSVLLVGLTINEFNTSKIA
jgi:O-antigen ligase